MKVGDTVGLKSGSPIMTVWALETREDIQWAELVWWTETDDGHQEFRQETLPVATLVNLSMDMRITDLVAKMSERLETRQ